VEVVRRVLQDPAQRYLLADEVGLGKTIEAGILIRPSTSTMIRIIGLWCWSPRH
jgi:hypothetical protein